MSPHLLLSPGPRQAVQPSYCALPAPGSRGSWAPRVLLDLMSPLFLVLSVVWGRMSSLSCKEKPFTYRKTVLTVSVGILCRWVCPLFPLFIVFPSLQKDPLPPASDIIGLVPSMKKAPRRGSHSAEQPRIARPLSLPQSDAA